MGALQMGLGALASVLVSMFSEHSILPMPIIMVSAAFLGLICLMVGFRFIKEEIQDTSGSPTMVH